MVDGEGERVAPDARAVGLGELGGGRGPHDTEYAAAPVSTWLLWTHASYTNGVVMAQLEQFSLQKRMVLAAPRQLI